jgi:dolichyl-phosphate-mannose--protein O-mannosyl transferase
VFRYDLRTTIATVALSVIGIGSRVWNIGMANFVVWDEAHFGKFHRVVRDGSCVREIRKLLLETGVLF